MSRAGLGGAVHGAAFLLCALGALRVSAATPEEELAARNIRVVTTTGAAAPEPLVRELWEGLRALPEPLRRVPGGALVFEVRDERSPFGMGDGSAARPEWREGRFVLYGFEEPDERRARYRLEALSAEDRERIWRRRAMVHALVQRWDDRFRWSQREGWKRITGWVEAGDHLLSFSEHGLNAYDWAYSRKRGMQSASLDLVTFAEEALVPVESIDPSALPIDDQLRCQEFSKTRFLAERFAALGANVEALSMRSAECPAFARWADLEHLSHLEVLLSAPSGQRLQSLFGHLMVRPAYDNDSGETRATDPVIEVAAITGFTEPPLEFLLKGAVGGYFNAYEELSVPTIRGEHVDRDARNVRRFALSLTDEEEVRVMERLWEAQRRGYYPYRFFSDNCASYVAFVLGGAVAPERLAVPAGPIVLPTGVLDLLPAQRDPKAMLSHRTVAAWAEREQDRFLDELVKLAPAHGAQWRAFASASRSASLEARRAAYRRLEPLVTATLADAKGARPAELALGIVDAAVRMERYAAQTAQESAHAVDVRRMVLPPGTHLPSTEELIAERQKRYEREAGTDRLHESLRRFIKWARFLEALPRRAPTPQEIAIAEWAAHSRDVFLALTASYGELVDRYRSVAQHSALPASFEEDRWPKERSGLGRLAIGGAALMPMGGAPRAELLVRSAFLNERLGERRQNGLDPLAELRLLESSMLWRLGSGLPSFEKLEMNVVRVRTMPREPSLMRSNVLHALGFGVAGSYERDRDGRQSYLGSAEAVLPLRASREYEHHVVLGLGPAVGASGGLLPEEASVGGRAELSARTQLFNAVPSSVRLDASWTPLWRTLGGPRVWANDVRTTLHFELAPSSRARAQVELLLDARWRWSPGAQPQRTVGAALAVGTP